MAAIIRFQIHDERGAEILAELEERTNQRSFKTSSGEREYHLSATEAGVDGLDQMLDLIDEDWHNQLSRLAQKRCVCARADDYLRSS